MRRIARVVVPGMPHHVTQRGNCRQRTFFCDDDYQAYLQLMAQWCGEWQVEFWCYCLMANHVHLIAVPASENALRQAIGEGHWRYTRRINFRERWRGHLWQGRFASFVMDESCLLAAAQ
jgi:putative transposase